MKNKSNRLIVTSGYNYTAGFSWIAAGEILNQPNIKEGVPLSMYYDTRRVLSFLLAWRQFPLFNGVSGRTGQWIAFGVDRMRSELGIRAERVRIAGNCDVQIPAQNLSAIVLLEQLGIIKCEHLNQSNPTWPTLADLEQLRLDATLLPTELGGGPAGYFNRHSFQSSNLFYRLADWLNLPELEQPFNPFLPSVESDLKQAQASLSQTWGGQRTATQASPKPDSSLHGGLWFSKGGYIRSKVDLSEAFRVGEVCYEKEAITSPNELTTLAQPLYQLLRQFHSSLTNYSGSGMSEAKAFELANRWMTQKLSFEQASVIANRLILDWNEGQSSIYSPVGVLIKRLETALSSAVPRSYSRRVTSNTFHASFGNKTTHLTSLKTVGQKGQGYSPSPGRKTIAWLEDAESLRAYEDGQNRETACLSSERNANDRGKDKDKEEINPDALWQQTLETLSTRLTPGKFQLLEGSRLEILSADAQNLVVRLVGEWQLRQLGQVDLNIIRLTLGQSLGQPAWKLRFTAQSVI